MWVILLLFQNSGLFWTPTLAVKALPADFVIRLSQSHARYKSGRDWLQLLRERDDQQEKAHRYCYTKNENVFGMQKFMFNY